MQLSIFLENIKPISLNHSHKITTRGKFASKYKTKAYVDLENEMNSALIKYKRDILEFNEIYKSGDYYLTAQYKFYYPILLKTGKAINKRSGDVSNLIKVCEDILFKHLVADDSEIITATVTKTHSEDIRTEIILDLKDLRHIL